LGNCLETRGGHRHVLQKLTSIHDSSFVMK